jgi:uncharacterized lipoprotein YbaY
VPFQLEFDADDDLLRHGLNIDARISVGGKVRCRTASAHGLTLGDVELSPRGLGRADFALTPRALP